MLRAKKIGRGGFRPNMTVFFFIVAINFVKRNENPIINFLFLLIWFKIKRNQITNRILKKTHESSDELTNFEKMLIIFGRGLLELNGVLFRRLYFLRFQRLISKFWT